MTKRIIALLLALILTVGLLPTVALAAEGNPPTTDSGSVTKEASKDNLNLVKTVTKEGDNYKVTLESWATGTVTSSSTPVPMDIILLLDQSGSMKKNFTSSSTETYNNLNKKNKKIYADYRNNCYIKSGNQYLKVTVTYQWEFGFSNDVYTYTWNGGSHTSTGGNSKPKIPLFYKSTTNSSTTRIAALKTAVSSFINKVNTEATTKNVDHRVAVVGFASTRSDYYENTELLSTPDVVNYGSANNIDYRNALVSAKTNKNKLDTAINRLAASGDTYPEYGFDMANQIFAQYPIQAGENRQRVVIMFTDGYPAPANTDNFNAGMANNAINNAKRCKDNNAKVYTIGIFDGADPSASIENYLQNQGVAANRYMHFSSSNYPSAMALNNGGTRGEGNFYFAASNADALNDIFDTISEEISTDTTELDGSATIIDNIPGNFAIPEGAQDITLKVAEFQKGGTFATATAAPTTVTAEHKDGTVTVTGFNFSDEWCGLDENDRPHGSKLIIEFTIHHNNYGGTQPTNAGASIKDEGNKDVITVDNPTVPVTISVPDDIFASAIEKPYNGTGFDILGNVASKADSLADGTKNKFVDIEVKVTVDDTDYTYTIKAGQTTGTWSATTRPTTSADVKDVNKDGVTEAYEYPVTITFKDAAQGSNASNSTTTNAKFKINYAEAKVKANDKSKKATEPDPDFDAKVTGMVNGEDATQKLTYTISRTDADDNTVGDHPTITPTGDTCQNNYKVTYETGTLTITKGDPTATEFSLTGKFQKTLNSNVAFDDLPAGANEFTIGIWEGNTAEGTPKYTATANINKLTASGSTYSETVSFGSVSLPIDAVGIKTYTVKEVVPTTHVAGMKYDTTAYTMTIKVEDKAGKLTVTEATVSNGTNAINLLNTTGTNSLEITNTFTAATLPLDPPKDPDGSVTGEGKVVKVMTGETREGSMTFTAKMTGDSFTGTKTATATVAANADRASFDGFGTLVFTKAGTYTYEIKEEAGNDAGVSYDGHTYTLTVVVTADGDELKITSATYTDNDTVAAGTALPVTITNRYTKPAYKIEKNVITDTSVKIPAWSLDYPDPVEIKVVVDADQQEIVLGYVIKITGSAGASFTLTEDEGSQFVTVHNADGEFTTVTPGKKLSFTLTQDHGNEHPILIYTTKVISRDPETGAFPAKVKNVVTEEDDTTHESGETTIEERGTLTVDFGALVRKHLTVTGDKSFNGATFTVNFTDGTFIKNEKENEPEISSVEVYAADAGVNERGLPNLTASVTYGADERNAGYKPFDGADLTIRVEGTYFYLVSEVIPDGATGYDTNKYIIGISVENDGDHLEVAGVGYSKYIENSQENPEITWNEGPTFHNTIDTGKDDYYPIIIPTIINKDTGMLNKTDHFAYVIGYPDGTVHPNGQITRAEVATIFFRLLRDEVRDGAFTTSNSYSDVAYGKWYNNPISTMSALGIITGYPDGTFKPNKPITRAEFAAIAARFDETQSGKSAIFSDVIGHWAAKEIGIAYYNDWIKGYPDGTFKPDQNITRAEAMTLINRVLERKPESPADLLTNMNKWTDNMDTSKWYYLDVQEATNSHGYTRKTFNYELWRQMLPDPDWSRYER